MTISSSLTKLGLLEQNSKYDYHNKLYSSLTTEHTLSCTFYPILYT